MPLVEFECGSCGLVSKVIVKTKDKKADRSCSCGGVATKKISSFGTSLKGSGFRRTEHASVDMRIGADATAKWEIYKQNWRDKQQLTKDNPGKQVVKDLSGSYTVQETVKGAPK